MKRLPRSVFLVTAIAVAGCGSIIGLSDFDIVNDADGGVDGAVVDTGAGTVDATVADAGADVTVVLPPVTCIADASACDGLDLDGGFRPVGVAQGKATACPDGFGALVLTKSGPITTTGACGCNVASTTPPTCANPLGVQLLGGNDPNSCTVQEGPVNMPANTCSPESNTFGRSFHEIQVPAASGGACTATADTKNVQTTTTDITICPPAGTCADAVCQGQKLGDLKACIIADGDLPCPSGPFSARFSVGDAVNVACPTCGCTVSNPTCVGQLQLFTDPNCTSTNKVLIDAGVCSQTTVGFQIESQKYVVTPTVTVTATGAGGTPTTSFTSPRTLCCVP